MSVIRKYRLVIEKNHIFRFNSVLSLNSNSKVPTVIEKLYLFATFRCLRVASAHWLFCGTFRKGTFFRLKTVTFAKKRFADEAWAHGSAPHLRHRRPLQQGLAAVMKGPATQIMPIRVTLKNWHKSRAHICTCTPTYGSTHTHIEVHLYLLISMFFVNPSIRLKCLP